ncbi:MAG: type restriction enzyme subunit [Acidobacteriota bacterium]|nr:type restriction enzyme subunit [Acidobacteriota bacterium]
MAEWKEYKIADVCELIIDCVNRTAPVVDYVTPYKMIRTTNVKNGKIKLENIRCVTKETYERWIRRGKPEKNDIVLTREAPVGEIGIVNTEDKIFLGQRMMMYRAKKGFTDARFLYYSFLAPFMQEQILSSGMGSVVEHIRVPDAKEFIVKLPPLLEQQAIAEVLSSLDDKIDLLHRQNKTLEAVTETLFRQWFIEEAEGSWEEVKLGEIADFHRGISYSGNLLGENGVGIPMHNLNSIDINGGYKYEGIKFYIGEVKDRQKLKPSDLLIINTDITQDNRIIGWPLFVPASFEYSTFTHHLFATTLLTEKISKFYLYFLLRQREYRDKLANSANGTTVSMLSKEAIRNLMIKLPPIIKRVKFERIAQETLNRQALNQKQLHTLTKLRDTLLPKMMNGEVRVET